MSTTTQIEFDTQKVLDYAKTGDIDSLKTLLEGCDDKIVNIADKDNQTPLYWASRRGYTEIVELLLFKGADINITSKNNRTPLNLASESGHTKVVAALLSNSLEDASSRIADVNIADKDNKTPLYWASLRGRTKIVELLLSKNADVNIANKDNETPLYKASFWNRTKIVELLLSKNADKDIANKYNKKPLDVTDDEKIKELLTVNNIRNYDLSKVPTDKIEPLDKLIKSAITVASI